MGLEKLMAGIDSTGVERPLKANSTGNLLIGVGSTAGDLGKIEDNPATNGDLGVFVLGVRSPAVPVANTSAPGDYASITVDAEGKLITAGYGDPVNTRQAYVNLTAITNVQLLASAGAGLRNYVTDITVENTAATVSRFILQDGTTTIFSCTIPASTTFQFDFGTPLRGTAATVLNGQLGAASTVTISIQGYIGV